jgi:hypothetical protein
MLQERNLKSFTSRQSNDQVKLSEMLVAVEAMDNIILGVTANNKQFILNASVVSFLQIA